VYLPAEDCFNAASAGGQVHCLVWLPRELAERRRKARERLKLKKAFKPRKKLAADLGGRIVPIPETEYYITAEPQPPSGRYACNTGCAFDGTPAGEVIDATLFSHKVFVFTCARGKGRERTLRDHILVCPLAGEGGLDLVYGYPAPKDRDEWLGLFHKMVNRLAPLKSAAEGAAAPALSSAPAGGAPNSGAPLVGAPLGGDTP
jgi:hypothetical protein